MRVRDYGTNESYRELGFREESELRREMERGRRRPVWGSGLNVVDQPLVNSLESIGAISFWIPVAVVLLAVLGLLWAPPAALTCMLAARFRKLEGESYAAAGAQHSMLLVLPWVYLLVRLLSGRALPVFIVAPVYILVYAIWFIFYIVGFNLGVLIASIVDVLVAHSQPLRKGCASFCRVECDAADKRLYVEDGP